MRIMSFEIHNFVSPPFTLSLRGHVLIEVVFRELVFILIFMSEARRIRGEVMKCKEIVREFESLR